MQGIKLMTFTFMRLHMCPQITNGTIRSTATIILTIISFNFAFISSRIGGFDRDGSMSRISWNGAVFTRPKMHLDFIRCDGMVNVSISKNKHVTSISKILITD